MELITKHKNTIRVVTILFFMPSLLVAIFVYFNDPILKLSLLLNYKSSFTTDASNYYPKKCDVFTGGWVPDSNAPYYTNQTCRSIHEHQNCMKFGRPDSAYLKWRWKPDGCEFLVFEPRLFFDTVRGKSMVFVGDSLGRNHLQSLICLLSKVEYPKDISPPNIPDEQFRHLHYVNYNFTLIFYWSPFLVRSEHRRDSDGPTHTGLFNLYLDEVDESWSTQIDGHDYVILNAGHWFTRTAVYYENRHVVGCRYCQLPNLTDFALTYGYRRAIRTALRAINGREKYNGVTYLRTFSPSHFENGTWNEGGNCLRRRPYMSDEINLEGGNLDMYMIELEEFRVSQRLGKKKMRLLDITHPMLLRPDGHPAQYGHRPNANVALYNDCVHWCLPGPIDSWAAFLLHMLKKEAH